MQDNLIRNDFTARKGWGDIKNNVSHFIDRRGNRMIYTVQDDYKLAPLRRIPSDTKQFVKDIKEFPCKEDDIFLVSYPKSGMHWMGNLVGMLARGNTKYSGTPNFIDLNDFVHIGNAEEPRVIGSHLPVQQLPEKILQGKGRVINISRNPKDCAVSHFTFFRKLPQSFYDGDLHSFLDYFYRGIIHYGKWFDHVKGFATADVEFPNANILQLRYEDMKLNLYDNILKIIRFLNLTYDEDFLREVEERCTFHNMQSGVPKEVGTDERLMMLKMLPIYTKGQIGEWKNWLTVSENEEFDAVIERELKETGIQYKYEL